MDIASLGIKITTDGVTKAEADLNKLQSTGAKAEKSAESVAKSFDKNAKSAKELQFALRGVPAQFTDIATSLASGQRPLQVLLQQGGQLKDMFGGIGPAARALGGYITGLINPFTVAAAAAVALAVAWKEGSDEAVAYNKALITTGSYAGLTADSLQVMAKAISQVAGTEHEAAAALAEVAGSGAFTAKQIALVGQAAIDMQRITGQATAATIKQFQDLQNDPVKAVLKLNDAQHFLTVELYNQIKALQESGRVQDAAALAQAGYARSLHDRAGDVEENAGIMVRAWHSVAGAAKGAWDAMLNVGRGQSLGDQVQALNDKINGLKIGQQTPDGNFRPGLTEESPQIKALRKQISDIYTQVEKANKEARDKSIKSQAVQALADSDREASIYATSEEKRVQAIAAAHAKANADVEKALAAGDKATAQRIRDNEAKIVAGINEQYKAPKARGSKKADPMAGISALAEQAYARNLETSNKPLNERAAILLKIAEAGGKAIASGANVAAVQAKVGDAVDQTNQYFDKQAVLLLQKNAVAMAAYQRAIDDQVAAKQRDIDLQVASVGLSEKEYRQQQELASIYEQVASNIEQLNRQRAQDGANTSLIDAQIAAQRASIPILVQQEKDKFKAIDAAQADWKNGAIAAYKDYADEAANVAGQVRDAFVGALDGLTNTLADFFSKGKADWRSYATDVLKQIEKILIAKAVAGIASSAASSFGFQGGTSASTFAKGGIMSSKGSLPLNKYANGGIANSPQLALFGEGRMNEAFVPLPDGRSIPVTMKGGGGSSLVLNQTINVDSSGNATEKNSGSSDDALRQFSSKMKSVAQQTIMEEQRPGGSLWRMAHA